MLQNVNKETLIIQIDSHLTSSSMRSSFRKTLTLLTKQRTTRFWLIAVIILAGLIRLGAALYMGNQVVNLPGIFDQISYDRLAQNLVAGNGFSMDMDWWPATRAGEPTAHWSYLMTLYLAGIYKLFGYHPLLARMIQAILSGILMPYLIFRLGKRVFNTEVGLIASAISAIYIYFFYYAAALMTETFFFLSVLSMLNAAIDLQEKPNWKSAVWLGVSLGCGVLLRQLLLLFIPFLLIWFIGSSYKALKWRHFLAVLGIPIALIIPFTIRNFFAFDQFVLLNTNAGYAFFWANHPIHGSNFLAVDEVGDYRALIPEELRSLDEASLDKALLHLGIQFVMDDPLRYIKLSFSRIPGYFWFWPSTRSGLLSNISRVGSFGIFLPFMIYGLYISIRQDLQQPIKKAFTSPSFLLYLFLLIYTIIHILTWTMVRYRLPVDTVQVIFAAITIFLFGIKMKIFEQSDLFGRDC